MIQLKDLSKENYGRIKSLGMLWEFHPEATGNWWEDCGKYQVNPINSEETYLVEFTD